MRLSSFRLSAETSAAQVCAGFACNDAVTIGCYTLSVTGASRENKYSRRLMKDLYR